LPAAAATTLLGMMLTSVSTMLACSRLVATIWLARSPPMASIASAWARSTPAPGFRMLAAASAIITAIEESRTVKPSVLTPIRFSERTSPISAMPTTSAEKSKGMTSMNSSLRKMLPIGVVT
jgi:hypothetical protein